MHEGSRRAIVAAFLANLGIAIAKFVAFAITRSASMLAEGIHSAADTGNQMLLFLGGAQAARAPDERRPFGYGRARYFWAFVVSLILFTLGGLFAIIEGIDKLRHPHELESPAWAFGILALALALEGFSLRTAVREASPLRRGRSWWSYVRESKTAELPVVLLEDFGALVGLTFALGGVTLAVVTDRARFDAAGSLVIGVLLLCIAVLLAVEMQSLLLGESASAEDEAAIRAALESTPAVRHLIHLRTEHLGPDHLLVAAKVDFETDLRAAGVSAAVDAAEAAVRAAVPAARWVYLEPDVYEPDHRSEHA